MLHREAEYELVPLSIDEQVGILVWSPLAGGLLSGKYGRDRTAPAGARHTTDWREPPIYDEDKMYAVIEALAEVASEHGHSPAQTALAYLLAKPGVTTLVVGARSGEQLGRQPGLGDVVPRRRARQRLDEVSAVPLIYPYWHQRNSASDRLSPGDLTLLGGQV